jgi:hypothetical protein
MYKSKMKKVTESKKMQKKCNKEVTKGCTKFSRRNEVTWSTETNKKKF